MDLAVDAQPGVAIILRQQIHKLGQAPDDVFPDVGDKAGAFLSDLHHDFATIVVRVGSRDIAELFQTIDHPCGCGCGVVHFLSNLRHAQRRLVGNEPQKKILGKGDLTRGQFPREVQHKTTLEYHDDVGEFFHFLAINTGLGRRSVVFC